jgi:hypothetical protein
MSDQGSQLQHLDWMPEFAITIQVVTTTLVTIRLVSRLTKVGGEPGLDDLLIAIAWILGLALTVVIVWGESHPTFLKVG